MLSGLLESEKKNPKEFWKSVNELMEKQKTDPSADISPEKWVEYFKSLMNIEYPNNFSDSLNNDNYIEDLDNTILNGDISPEEVLKGAKGLKGGKSCGIDEISNEMLQLSVPILANAYAYLFSQIIKSGKYPSIWRENMIKPIYKGGGTANASNYRGIAISSCFGKLFSRVLFNRLDKYLEDNNIIGSEQIGFRKQCRTTDHILTLKTLIDKSFKSSARLYACFVDLSKAFDTINRHALFYKMSKYNIKGPFLNIVQDMYRNLTYCIKTDDGLSSSFETKIGVKQCCVLSPALFSLYLNDLTKSFEVGCDPVSLGNNGLHISCLMYADDIVLLSQTANGLQKLLCRLEDFCTRWNLKVNIDKAKVIIFNKSGSILKGHNFLFGYNMIELVNEYKYLGIYFRSSGVFTQGIEYLCNKALKAIFCIRKALMSDGMNAGLYVTLFNHCVKPIFLYGSEVWSLDFIINKPGLPRLENRYDLFTPEKIQLKFLKNVLGVHKYSVNDAVRAEFGILPIAIFGLQASTNFWVHLINLSESSLAYQSYKDSMNFPKGFAQKFKIFLHKINFSHLWDNQSTFSKKRLSHAIVNNLKDSYINFWTDKIHDDSKSLPNGNKLRTYRTFKSLYERETYLFVNELPKMEISTFAKLRISAHDLHIEKGRHTKTKLSNRKCFLCGIGVEDERHFVMNCSSLSTYRDTFFEELVNIVPSFVSKNIEEKFTFIMECTDYKIAYICISNIYKMFRARDTLINNKSSK